MRASLMFIPCGLFLVLSAFVPQTTANSTTTLQAAQIGMNVSEPMSILHGEYHLEDVDHLAYRPSWASVWKISADDINNGEFFVSFWPPKYCHAIYICPVTKDNYNDVTFFKTEDSTCDSQYIKYYPHIKQVKLKADAANSEETKTLMSNRLEFEIEANYKTKLRVLNTEPANFEKWKDAMKQGDTFTIDLNKKDLLILTNSRMCQVNKPGSKFYPFFKSATINDTSGDFPKWFHDTQNIIQTDTLPPNQAIGSGKTLDLLDYIKGLDWNNGKVGKLDKKCDNFGKSGSQGRKEKPNALFRSVSVHSYNVDVPNSVFTSRTVKQFSLNIQTCHWFRIWFSAPTDDIKDYKTKLDLKNTIDVFLTEGFYINPESNIAHPLPSVTELTAFTFRAQTDKALGNLVEMSYGDIQGRRVYYEHFNLTLVQENKFKMHIIKAPGCELSLDKGYNLWTDYSTNKINQIWDVSQCSYSFFKQT